MELDGRPATVDDTKALALYNYGHFTSMRVENGGVRGLSLHLRRLVDDCRVLFDTGLDPDRVRHLVRRALRDVTDPVVVRVTVFDPGLQLGQPGAAADPHLLVSFRPAPEGPLPPLRVRSARYRRDMPRVKHVGLFGMFQLRRAAQRAGFDDVLFVDSSASVCEGATWNIGFVNGDRVIWPEADVLPGVTVALLGRTYEPTSTEPVTLGEVPNMVAAFATNAANGVRPIGMIDSVRLAADHPVSEQLRKTYADVPPEPV